jgi:DnaJ-class molecular chaperone
MGDACGRCKGTGEIWRGYPPRIPCPACHGTGRRGG